VLLLPLRAPGGTLFGVTRLADWFAVRSARGILTRAAGSWLLVGLPVIAARIWWSVAAAIAIFVLAVTMYVAATVRYMNRHR
jgi:hypothetical protein